MLDATAHEALWMLECHLLKPDLPLTWLQPEWPAPATVRAVMTDRHGGVSVSPWDSMNVGDHVGDHPDAVAINLARWQAALHRRPVFLQQVHGVHCVALDAATPDGTAADACLATTPDVACTIMVADCLPVLFCAAWRGRAVLACSRPCSVRCRQATGHTATSWLGWGLALGRRLLKSAKKFALCFVMQIRRRLRVSGP